MFVLTEVWKFTYKEKDGRKLTSAHIPRGPNFGRQSVKALGPKSQNWPNLVCDCFSYRKRSKEVLTNWQKEKLFPWLQTAIWTLCNVLFVNVCVGIDGCFNLRFCDELAAGGGEYCTVHVNICTRVSSCSARYNLLQRKSSAPGSSGTLRPSHRCHWSALTFDIATSSVLPLSSDTPSIWILQVIFGNIIFITLSILPSAPIFFSETVHLGTLNTSFIIKLFILPNIDFFFSDLLSLFSTFSR